MQRGTQMASTSTGSRASTTIRIPTSVRDELLEIATAEDQRIGDVIRALLEERRKRKFWDEMRIAVERTKADPEDWAEYQAEIARWDTTSADGLSIDEDWTGMWEGAE